MSTSSDPRESTSRLKVTRSSVSLGLTPVRVGGGFLTLDEFLRINVPVELEKMAQRDPINVLSKNIAVNSVIAGRAVNQRETNKITPLNYTSALNFTRESLS